MKVLVTGGGGFLGSRIVELLSAQGDAPIVMGRSEYQHLSSAGVECIIGDVRQTIEVERAVELADEVIHVASAVGYWGPMERYWATNVLGVQNVIDACVKHGVQRLVYTSTPSVESFDSNRQNSAPISNYGISKAEAEKRILYANGSGRDTFRLDTLSLRPHLVFGPKDPNILPRLFDRAREGKLKIIGSGGNTVDFTYVDNAAWAHLDALNALRKSPEKCAGKSYFITNGEPVHMWDWLNGLFNQMGYPSVRDRIPHWAARLAGGIEERAHRIFAYGDREPRMTKFLADALALDHTYSIEPAKTDFGYYPRIDMKTATKLTVQYFKKAEKEVQTYAI